MSKLWILVVASFTLGAASPAMAGKTGRTARKVAKRVAKAPIDKHGESQPLLLPGHMGKRISPTEVLVQSTQPGGDTVVRTFQIAGKGKIVRTDTLTVNGKQMKTLTSKQAPSK